jgi:hypothetical protein
VIGSIFPRVERLGVEMGVVGKQFLSILPKNQDWEWVLETPGDTKNKETKFQCMILFPSCILPFSVISTWDQDHGTDGTSLSALI